MGIINRFLLGIYGAAVGVLSLSVAAVCLKILPEHVWLNELRYALLQQEALTAAGVFALLSVYFVAYSLFSRHSSAPAPKEVVVVKGEEGEVGIAVEAVRNLAEREAQAVTSVRDVKVQVRTSAKSGENPLRLEVRLVLLAGANVPRVSDAVIASIKKGIRQTMDFPDVPVSVTVSDISNAPVENGKRVV